MTRIRPSRAALAAVGRAISEEQAATRSAGSSPLPQAQRTPSGAPYVAEPVRAVELEEDGTFPVITPVGSSTTHVGRYEGNFTVPVCTGKRLADAGYGLTSGTSAADVSCQRCKPLAPAAPKRRATTRKPQINHRLCSHAQTPAARRQCRNHAARLPELAGLVDQAHLEVLEANAASPYVSEEYDRCERILGAALLVFANGDERYAYALRQHLLDSGESVMWYVTQFSRETIMEWADRDR